MRANKHPKKTAQRDWHTADIKAALQKNGWSLRQLSMHHGYNPDVLKNVLRKPWPKGERIIADAIGTTPAHIWPSRFDKQFNTRAKGLHVKKCKGAEHG